MTVFVLDTNIVSYYLKGDDRVIGNIERAIIAGDSVLIAPIAYYEVKRGLLAVKSHRRLTEFLRFCEEFSVGKLDNDLLDIAAEIYADRKNVGRKIEDADIFIAAYCESNGYTLVTHNMKHFEQIAGLRVVDWAVDA